MSEASDPSSREAPPARPRLLGQLSLPFHRPMRPATFRARLDGALDAFPVEALLLDARGPQGLRDYCFDVAAARGVAVYLWHPLLENTSGANEALEVVGFDGGRAAWSAHAGSASFQPFRFLCPNHPESGRLVLGGVERLLASAEVAGLFLDKIRFPSPASGLPTSIGCFCGHCERAAREYGVDLTQVRSRLALVLSSRVQEEGLASLGLGDAGLADPLLKRWQEFRAETIRAVVAEAASIARKVSCHVGLDLFAPALSGFVGQNYEALAPIADWVKPMLYCRSWVPSGFPIEIDGVVRGFARGARARVGEALGLRIPSGRRLRDEGLPLEYAAAQAEGAQRRIGAIPVFAGVEVADRPGICRITRRVTRRYGRLLRARGVAGVVASPDIVLAAPENLAAFADGLLD